MRMRVLGQVGAVEERDEMEGGRRGVGVKRNGGVKIPEA